MYRSFIRSAAGVMGLLLLAPISIVHAITLAGSPVDAQLGLQSRYYLQEAAYGQDRQAAAVRLQLAYFTDFNDGQDYLQFLSRVRWDSMDGERTRGDIEELAWIHVRDHWELRAGIRKVFWGVTESRNLVDIINQSDLADFPDGETKLGQPMINLSTIRDWGILDLYLLAGHRERIFPGRDGRFRGPVGLSDETEYESRAGRNRIDLAARWQFSLAGINLALSHFSGTSRDPVADELDDEQRFIPFYPLIEQTGLEAQAIWDAWLWKLEWIHRADNEERFNAATFGFEYTQIGIAGTAMDLGWILESNYDDRGREGPSPGERDIMLASRLSLNDFAGSSVLVGATIDIEHGEALGFLQAEKRLTDALKLNADVVFVSRSATPPSRADVLDSVPLGTRKYATVSRDDMVQLELTYFF